jgi:phosphonopyruvate decarboxylase
MLDAAEFCKTLESNRFTFFTGVPDSLLKDLTGYITSNVPPENHITAANEGNAVALAVGHYLATGTPGVVYMQNSGIGNAVNPLLSLADEMVYGIPLLLVIGWRGEPGRKPDEPQHLKQGQVTLDLLSAMDIEYDVLSADTSDPYKVINTAAKQTIETSKPHAIVISAGTFEKFNYSNDARSDASMTREQAIEAIVDYTVEDSIFVSTTGMTSRELFEIRESKQQGHSADFLTVGSMGHTSQIALAIAQSSTERQIVCIDGDGAALMHAGGLATIGSIAPPNLLHIVINNGVHDSVGAQPIAGTGVNFPALAKASGYLNSKTASSVPELQSALNELNIDDGPSFIEVIVRPGARSDLGRPTSTPIENRDALMSNLRLGK